MALSDLLMERDKKELERCKEEEVARKLVQLKRKKQELENKEKRLKEEINTGVPVTPSNENLPEDRLTLTEEEAENMFSITKYKQKLESLAYLTGITAWKQDNDEIHFTFDPYIRGYPRGPYVLRMKPKQDRMSLLGHTFPNAVPIITLYSDYIKDRSKDNQESLWTFLRTIFRYLKAFLSREDQVKELRDGDLDDNIKEIKPFKNYTDLTIVLDLLENEDSGPSTNRTVTISLKYEKDAERPTMGSIEVDTEMDEDKEALHKQCLFFYNKRLKDAILEGF